MAGADEFSIPESRPRALLGGGFLEELRRRAESTHEQEFARLLLWARNVPHRPDSDFEHRGFGEHGLYRLALLYAMRGEPRFLESARRVARLVLARKPTSRYGTGNMRLWALSAYYDWCHRGLSEDERAEVRRVMLQYVDLLYRDELNNISAGTSYIAGHGVNQVPAVMLAAVALYGEDPRGEELIGKMLKRCREMFRCYEYYLREGSFYMWWAYGVTYMRELPPIFNIARYSLGLDWWTECSWYENYIWWMLYGLRGDWTWPCTGDFYGADLGWLPGSYVASLRKSAVIHRIVAAISSEYGNPYAGWLVSKMRAKGSRRGGLFGIEDQRLVYEKRHYDVKAPSGLPLSRIFEHAGVLISREDWLEGTHVLYKATPAYHHNHTHRDAGHFAIFHRGDLGMDSGSYDGYESPHWYNYYIRTISHNCLLIVDPEERFVSRGKEYANDGGQCFVNEPHWAPLVLEDLSRDEYRSCETLSAEVADDYDHMHSDLTPAYSDAKAARVTRHLAVVRRPSGWPHPVVFVRDVVETKAAAHAVKWLLHTEKEPEVSGATAAAVTGEGRLHSVTLLPVRPRIETVGGPGREFLVDGVNYAAKHVREEVDAGAWRLEISGDGEPLESGGARHDYLHALFTSDVSEARRPEAELARVKGGREAVGLVAAGTLVIFAGGDLPLEVDLAADVEAALVLEVPPFEHLVLSGPASADAASTESGAFFVRGSLPAGTYRLERHS